MIAFLRRFWLAELVLLLVVAHAAIIGYVRSQVARIKQAQSSVVEVGHFRFQTALDPSTVYVFDLHAIPAAGHRWQSEELLHQYRVELREQIEQTLRQVDPAWLTDPVHTELRVRLRDLLLEKLNQPVIDRLIITSWLRLPAHEFPRSNSSLAASRS